MTGIRTLAEARNQLMGTDRWEPEGAPCPCCDQLSKVYHRKLNSVAVRTLLWLYRDHGFEFAHIGEVVTRRLGKSANQGGDRVLSAYWGFIEEERVRRPDGGRAGYWRVTEDGAEFVENRARVQSHALIYDAHLLDYEGDYVTIADCLGTKFNYNELMGWATT